MLRLGSVSNGIASLFWQAHVVHGAGAGGELREYESGGLGAGHRLVGVDERELLPELRRCNKKAEFPYKSISLLYARCGSNSWTGFCCLRFLPFSDPDITSFGPAGQASKFPVMESSLLS